MGAVGRELKLYKKVIGVREYEEKNLRWLKGRER